MALTTGDGVAPLALALVVLEALDMEASVGEALDSTVVSDLTVLVGEALDTEVLVLDTEVLDTEALVLTLGLDTEVSDLTVLDTEGSAMEDSVTDAAEVFTDITTWPLIEVEEVSIIETALLIMR